MLFDKLFTPIKTNTDIATNTITFDPKFKIYDYSDSNKTEEEKIILEKRRRNQVYNTLDYVLSGITYFDFFSHDTIQIIKESKYLTQSCDTKRKVLTSEFLLLSFFSSNSDLSKILLEHHLNPQKIELFVSQLNQLSSRSLNDQKNYFIYKSFKNVLDFSFLKKYFFNSKIKYGFDFNILLTKTADNALERFKTPVITPDILFITMMEEKDKKTGKMIKSFLKTETDWYVLRYKLIKRIHLQESHIRAEKKNQHYFAYLLKINLSEFEFNRLIENELLNLGISTFRNKIVTKMLSLNIFDLLEADIKKESRTLKERKYSK